MFNEFKRAVELLIPLPEIEQGGADIVRERSSDVEESTRNVGAIVEAMIGETPQRRERVADIAEQADGILSPEVVAVEKNTPSVAKTPPMEETVVAETVQQNIPEIDNIRRKITEIYASLSEDQFTLAA